MKCGSKYAAVQSTKNLMGGYKIHTVYCANCKLTYEVKEAAPPIKGFKKIIDVKTDSVFADQKEIAIGSYKGVFGMMSSNGDFVFTALEMCRFRGTDRPYCWGLFFEFQESGTNSPACFISLTVKDIVLEPEFVRLLKNTKPYEMKAEALKGNVPSLSEDLAEQLNKLLVSQSHNRKILLTANSKKKKGLFDL